MSLASFLLGPKSSEKKKAIDTELDALFHSHTVLDHPVTTPTAEKIRKRKHNVHADEPLSKRSKPFLAEAASSFVSFPGGQKKGGKNHIRSSAETVPEHGTSDIVKGDSLESENLESLEENGNVQPTLIHETFRCGRSVPTKQAGRKVKFAPSDETAERRDARTIFIGNLAPDVAIKRPLQKQLHRHILALLPTAKIESTRFRSVAFQTPTSKLLEVTDEVKRNKQPRQHDRDRASTWRDIHAADESKTDERKFLTPSQKKKIAFINRDIHSNADSVHAYVVFAYPVPPDSRPANLPPPLPVMDPFEATRLAIERCDGTMFLDRMLCIDAIVKKSTAGCSSDSTPLSSVSGDPKLTIFVGNLEFASKEEDLRTFFEGVVSAERGPRGSEDGDKPKCWVTRIRMIRDKDTQLGKGFAYVQFSDRTCVDEILALETGKLKFAKRKLRVQRCRLVSNTAGSVEKYPPSKEISNRIVVPHIPKGDPSLGEKLVKLTKEERKRIKATDADRIARRMAKKKARIALAKQGVSLQTNQRRDRVRKTGPSVLRKSVAAPAKKARVRSEKSMAKKNMKK